MSRTPVTAARPKRAINVTVRGDLLEAARAAGVNLSATLERALEEELREIKRTDWQLQHVQAIKAYNAHVRGRAPPLGENAAF